MAARGNAAHLRLARLHGATLLERCPVSAVHDSDGEIAIDTAAGVFRCRKLIVASGPWTNQILAHLGMRLPLTVTKEQVTYFAADPDLFAPGRFPIPPPLAGTGGRE